jgi:hypothetical protein
MQDSKRAKRISPIFCGGFMSGILLHRTVALFGALLLTSSIPALAEIRSVDPSAAATLAPPVLSRSVPTPALPGASDVNGDLVPLAVGEPAAVASSTAVTATPETPATTYHKDDVIGAAEGVFGEGAKGLGGIIEKILKDQGEPDGYIAGREASAAFVVGLRYGSGTLTHNVEGPRPVYWTGPSIGFDVGGDATKVFVLVYNLYDSQDLYKRYPQVEGRAYFVGGFSATYLRRGNVALIPVRLGVGVRLGANIGYMKFSEKSKWLPF